MTLRAVVARRNVVGALAGRDGSVMTRHARLRDRAVVHRCGFEEARRLAVAGVARRRGRNVRSRFAERNRIVVATVTRFRRAFEYAARVTGLARDKFVRPHQGKPGRQVIEVEQRLRNRRGVGGHNTHYKENKYGKKQSPHSYAYVRVQIHVSTSLFRRYTRRPAAAHYENCSA